MPLKVIIILAVLAIASGFTLPDQQQIGRNNDLQPMPRLIRPWNGVLVRNARSPDGRFDASVSHHSRYGTSASIDYNHSFNKNFDAYVGVSRDFTHNNNGVHAGFVYRFGK